MSENSPRDVSRDERDLVTRLSEATAAGSEEAAEELLPLVYDELHRLAAGYLRGERVGHTLRPTALVHEAYLRLLDCDRIDWQGKTHFKAMGARAMRRILVDHARHRGRIKRGGDRQRVTLDAAVAVRPGLEQVEALALSRALEKLAEVDPREAQVVELRFLGGLTVAEVAEVLGVSRRTVEGDWTHARAWLQRELDRE